VSDFGDFDVEDAFDTEPADPEQVARRLHKFRHDEGLEGVEWEDLTPQRRAVLVLIVTRLIELFRRQGLI
jgi:hypothetical protein